jgi:hypothetical protein
MCPHISGTERVNFLKQDAFRLSPKVSEANEFQNELDQFELKLIQIHYIQIRYIQFSIKSDT